MAGTYDHSGNLTSIKTTIPVTGENVGYSTSHYVDGNDSRSKESLRRRGRTGLEKGLYFVAAVLFLSVIGLIIGLVISLRNKKDEIPVCLSDECTMAASRVLESMDQSVDPCEDFYTYACGTWKKTHVIPEDRTSLGVFGVLRDEIQVINKVLLEDPDNYGINETAWRKAKDMHASCINMDLIEQKNTSVTLPLLQELGGWPVLGSNPGGHWNETNFNLVSLLVTLRKYNNKPVMELNVGSDARNSTQHIIYLDQPDFGLPGRNYYLYKRFSHLQEAYVVFARTVAILFGADPSIADKEMREMLQFETELANLTMRREERRDSEALYNRMTIAELKENITEPKPSDNIQFNWLNYIAGIMGQDHVDLTVTDSEPVVVQAVPYFKRLFHVLQKYSKRIIANYIVWSIMQHRVNNLPSRFLEARDEYFKALEMIGNIRGAFSEILNEADWMDEHTKGLAREKADAIRNWIGYPDDILDSEIVNEMYENYTTDKNEYFQNVLNNLQTRSAEGLMYLREPYNKNGWGTPPTKVNAFYNPILNNIMFPAGILQPPFYGKNQPKSMNYGGIGVIIGHEITHGFDDEGRQYNKDGDLQQWWDQKIIDNFKAKAQCIVDQYGSFYVPEANMTVNGINTQGENIADNGGIKESFRAYRHWVDEQGKEEARLPGLELTHNKLFFVSFAQVYCNNMREKAAINAIQTDSHSPDQVRVIGTLQNSEDFARAFNCPSTSRMNPDRKCHVW